MTKVAAVDNRRCWRLVALATVVMAMVPISILAIRG